ncbi:MAG: glutamine-hydrolyzing GMP synthase [Candidatus Omnitrophica bacterium]|nr:glutamine-hydrolyzing GMP synthase [bacterium]MCE7908262.1 glutamine-hydrolyzing GMP synthase [Candidatus Omnitrophica bacterium COP1]MCL4735172.1 glutamine-hydrolyzing GMP synthase [Candidatus Omnitrophota bacterium]MBV6481999.1 GMP synthase [glutamine-hydrolyzing] [bacterium]MCK6496695.1 glutamine-hydrolyzing GMP synthase [bacterium]
MTGRDEILILDFGSQYNQLIARRVREQGVYCRIFPYHLSIEEIRHIAPRGIILSGGPSSVIAPGAPLPDPGIFDLGIPILGICYGLQVMGHLLKGKVDPSQQREFGFATLSQTGGGSRLFEGLGASFQVWMSHGDRVSQLPPGFIVIGTSENSPVAALSNEAGRLYGVQFHPEVVHTPEGAQILGNFVKKVCGCAGDWTMGSFVENAVEDIRRKVGEGRVLCAVSGGVDSSVAAALVARAIGDRLTCIFVDNGLLRHEEGVRVQQILRDRLGINLRFVDASARFLKNLSGITDPEQKRKIIGRTFIEVFEEEASKIGRVDFLVQGTLYPDVIESVSVAGPSATIKSHHNVGGLPETMKLDLIEPLRELFKDEVRQVGLVLGLDEDMVFRQPFPGPGLAVRILGEVTGEACGLLRKADKIVLEEFKATGWYRKVWQSFAVLLPIRSVGVMGDERTYDRAIALRVVDSADGMTADWVDLPPDLLRRISNRIVNEVKGINRVVYDISSKPPSTIEWE